MKNCQKCIASILFAFSALLFVGCKSYQKLQTESLTEQKNSIYVEDSGFRQVDSVVIVKEHYIFEKGDTVREKEIEYRDRVHLKYDTCYIEKIDSVVVERRIPYAVEKQVKYIPTYVKWVIVIESILILLFLFYKKL